MTTYEPIEDLEAVRQLPGEARREAAVRTVARKRLINFITRMRPGYEAGWAHKLICAKLERFLADVIARRSPRLIINTPPRFGKSTIVSQDFLAWALGQYPWLEVIAASYAVSLPMDFSRKVKNMLRTPEYHALFPTTRLDPQAQATDGWYTTERGAYLPAGVDGGVTGRGAHILSIDDPVKGKSSAESDHQRNVMWGWWDTEAESRLAPGAGVLLTQTRWIDDDLSGRLLAQERELNREFDEQIEAIELELKTPPTTLRPSSKTSLSRPNVVAPKRSSTGKCSVSPHLPTPMSTSPLNTSLWRRTLHP